MIGVSDFWKQIPVDPIKNVAWRIRLLEECERNPQLRSDIREICKRDIRFFMSAFGYQFNPDETGDELGPWISYAFQNEAIIEAVEWWLAKRMDYNWEKSRKVGASWMVLFIQAWACLFHHWKKFIEVSHTEDAVIADDSDSLFWKINHIHEHLPAFLSRGVEKSKRRFNYKATKSAIAGRSQTKRTGVGGRGNVFCDEVGKMENAKAIIGQTVATGPRFFVSTHYPEGNEYAKLCDRSDLKKRVLHWAMHPKYNEGLYKWDKESKSVIFGKWNQKAKQIEPCKKYFDYDGFARSLGRAEFAFITDGYPTGGPFPGWRSPWYDKESARYQTRREVCIHLDIDRQGSESQVFDPMAIAELRITRAMNPVFQGDILVDSVTCEVNRMVERYPGPLKMWVKPDHKGQYEPGKYGAGIDPARGSGATPTCMSIVNAATGRKVLEYRDAHIEPHEFAPKAVALCKMFHNAILVWEIPGPGIDLGKHIIQTCGYRKIWKQRTEMPHRMTVVHTDKPGWVNNSANCDKLVTAYKVALEERKFANPSDGALSECLDYKWNMQGHAEHKEYADDSVDESGVRVNHGDLVIADALAWMVCVMLGIERPKSEKPDPESIKPGSWLDRRRIVEEMDRAYEEEYGLAE